MPSEEEKCREGGTENVEVTGMLNGYARARMGGAEQNDEEVEGRTHRVTRAREEKMSVLMHLSEGRMGARGGRPFVSRWKRKWERWGPRTSPRVGQGWRDQTAM